MPRQGTSAGGNHTFPGMAAQPGNPKAAVPNWDASVGAMTPHCPGTGSSPRAAGAVRVSGAANAVDPRSEGAEGGGGCQPGAAARNSPCGNVERICGSGRTPLRWLPASGSVDHTDGSVSCALAEESTADTALAAGTALAAATGEELAVICAAAPPLTVTQAPGGRAASTCTPPLPQCDGLPARSVGVPPGEEGT